MKIPQAFFVLSVGLIMACQPMSDFEVERYFQLDSLLISQSELLSNMEVTINKSVQMDEKYEEISFKPDTLRMAKEFQIIKDFSLNKNKYIGAFTIKKNGKSVLYTKKKGQPVPVSRFLVKYENELSLVSGQYFEDKDIFQHERNFELRFDDSGVLSAYSIWGFQKMILQDTIKYNITGLISSSKN